MCGDYGGGSPPPPPPPELPLEDPDDFGSDSIPPNCNSQTLNQVEKNWCKGSVPTGTNRSRILDAIGRLVQRGGVCSERAALISALLGKDRIRLFLGVQGDGAGGASGLNHGANGWVVLDERFASLAYDEAHLDIAGRTVLSELVHETDHLEGLDHVATGPMGNQLTPNQIGCGS